ncbi:hypothetical protein ACU8KH_02606 [Lachancea thermotolerans]
MELIKGRQGLRQVLCHSHGVVAPATDTRTSPRAPQSSVGSDKGFEIGSDADFLC